MIQTYDTRHPGTTKVFMIVKNNEVTSVVIGNHAVATEQGYQFYVDNHIAEQIHKCELYLDGFTPKLRVKEGEELEIPDEIKEKEREIEELERRLKELKGEEDAG